MIADDERLMREQLRTRLAEAWPELEIVAEAKNGAEAVQLVEQHRSDIAFLDIRMPGMTGVEAARDRAAALGDESADGWAGCELVFITAYDECAVEAFEQGAADYAQAAERQAPRAHRRAAAQNASPARARRGARRWAACSSCCRSSRRT